MADTLSGGIGHAENDFWKAVAATVTGPMHRKHGLGCDDTFAFAFVKDWSIIVVCDGAGSAKKGADGAALISSSIVANLESAIANRPPRRSIRQAVSEAVASARDELTTRIGDGETKLDDYHTTVLGAVCRGRRGIFFHIGDGAAMCFRDQNRELGHWEPTGFSSPTNGESAEITVFVTDVLWQDHLHFFPISTTDVVCLMTDGVTPFALLRGNVGPDPEFFNGVHSFLASNGAEDGARSLYKLLDSPSVQKASFDDKTLVWLAARTASAD